MTSHEESVIIRVRNINRTANYALIAFGIICFAIFLLSDMPFEYKIFLVFLGIIFIFCGVYLNNRKIILTPESMLIQSWSWNRWSIFDGKGEQIKDSSPSKWFSFGDMKSVILGRESNIRSHADNTGDSRLKKVLESYRIVLLSREPSVTDIDSTYRLMYINFKDGSSRMFSLGPFADDNIHLIIDHLRKAGVKTTSYI